MKSIKHIPYYIALALCSGAALLFFKWPFYEQALVLSVISVPVLLVLSRQWIPVYLFIVLLISIAFALSEPVTAVASIGTYFLMALFQFSLWSSAELLRRQAEETGQLRKRRDALLLQEGDLRALNLQEFFEQALWMMHTKNTKERTWLMEIVPSFGNAEMLPKIESAVLGHVFGECDLVTSTETSVYVLVKETEEKNLQSLSHRLIAEMPAGHGEAYEIRKTLINGVGEMRGLLS